MCIRDSYERGRHGFIYLNNIKSPLFLLKFLKLYLFCLPMLVTLCFIDLFSYKTPLHRKWVKLKCVWYLLFDALLYSTLIHMRALSKSLCLAKRFKEKRLWETTHRFYLLLFLFSLSQGVLSLL